MKLRLLMLLSTLPVLLILSTRCMAQSDVTPKITVIKAYPDGGYILDINGRQVTTVTEAQAKQYEKNAVDLAAAQKVIADQQTDIASLKREIGLLNQVTTIGDKIDKLRADQIDQFGKFTLRQQVMEQKLDTSTTTPKKGKLERFVESWQVKFAFTALGGAANFRTLAFPPTAAPCK